MDLDLAMNLADDFLIAGDNLSPEWRAAMDKFKKAFRWSPWESTPFLRCGVTINQLEGHSFVLSHDEDCTEIKQVEIDKKQDFITDEEYSQCRAVLGAVQWRVLQSAPQHAAKLSWLQSALPHSKHNKDLLQQVNKEVHAQRHLSVHVKQLNVDRLEDIAFATWTDAAVGNRPDMTSTGGYLVAMVGRGPKGIGESSFMEVGQAAAGGSLQPCGGSPGALGRRARADALSLPMGRTDEQGGESSHLALATQQAAMVVDATSVYDAVQKGETASSAHSMKEKYAALELMSVAENLRLQGTRLLWVSSTLNCPMA